jgi:hypothetical protein
MEKFDGDKKKFFKEHAPAKGRGDSDDFNTGGSLNLVQGEKSGMEPIYNAAVYRKLAGVRTIADHICSGCKQGFARGSYHSFGSPRASPTAASLYG